MRYLLHSYLHYFFIEMVWVRLTRLLRLFEKLLAGKDNYTIYGSQSSSSAEIHLTEQEAGGDGR